MSFGFVDPWHLFLPREGGHVISIMGSGGKTSLMLAMAEVYRDSSLPVVLTTTTLSEILPDMEGVDFRDFPSLDSSSLSDVFFLHGGTTPEGKWAGLTSAQVDELGGLLPDRIVIAEVDGSAKMPVKIHRDDEPVWPARTSLSIVVMGTSSIGSKTEDVLHRFGKREWAPLEDLKAWTVWEWSHARTLLLEPGGYLSRVPEGIPCVLALTGMDEQGDSIGLFEFVGQAMEDARLPLTMFCDFGKESPVIRTACNEEDEPR